MPSDSNLDENEKKFNDKYGALVRQKWKEYSHEDWDFIDRCIRSKCLFTLLMLKSFDGKPIALQPFVDVCKTTIKCRSFKLLESKNTICRGLCTDEKGEQHETSELIAVCVTTENGNIKLGQGKKINGVYYDCLYFVSITGELYCVNGANLYSVDNVKATTDLYILRLLKIDS